MAASVSQLNTLIPSGGVYESVDLGLPSGTKWARFNIGATSETDYGDLFAWGATEPYRLNGSTSIDNTGNYASSYANTIQHDLYPNEDAATVKWGKGWRMPTKAQFDELLANTTSEWTAIGGVNGRKLTSKADTSKYIFFPAAGFVNNSSLLYREGDVSVWSHSIDTYVRSWRLHSNSSELHVYSDNRMLGLSVRPVRAQ